MALLEGQTISHYRILEQLGSGGMGMVYKAHDLKLDRLVALKFLPPELKRDPEAKERLVHEARAASSLQHPNICVVYDIDETDDGQIFISMECLEGETLEQTIRTGPPPLDRTLNIARQIAQGLAKAHAAGIVHRDIKPANIIITRDGIPKLLDFGLAKSTNRTLRTIAGTLLGTAAYMSPEQARGVEADQRSDVWSLGVVLYEMVTGSRPFTEPYEQAVLYSIVHERHRPPSALRPEVTAGLEALIDRCLAKAPEARFPDAGAFLTALSGLAAEPPRPQTAAARSIAALPFEDISQEMDNRYFSDGLTDEIITKLSKLRNLRVVSRTSVMHYERSGKTVRQIAGDLGVQYLLEGSVRKHGPRLRITTHLIDAGQDSSVWAETFDGTMDEVFDIQEKVASLVVRAMKVHLSPEEKRKLKRRATKDTEAFQLYLKGRFFWNKRSAEGLEAALRYFEQAIEQDARYAPAWVGVADCYILLRERGARPKKTAFASAREAIRKALEYDDQLAEAHASLGIVHMLDDLNLARAEQEFRQAIALNPSYATGHHWYSDLLSKQGRFEEATAEASRAAALDPLSPAIIKDLGMVLYYAGDLDGAIKQARKALELDPHFGSAHRLLSLAYLGKGMLPEAVAENQLWSEQGASPVDAALGLAYLHAAAGRRDEALRMVAALNSADDEGGNLYRGLALVYTALGEKDLAFQWLEKAYEKHADNLITLRVDPKMESLRTDPRFTALLRKLGLIQ